MSRLHDPKSKLGKACAEYIKRRLAGEVGIVLRDLAAKHGLKHTTILNFSGSWERAALSEIAERDRRVQEELAISHQQVVDNIRKQFSVDLEEVFGRQIGAYRKMAALGMRHLEMYEQDEVLRLMDSELAANLMRVGLAGELKTVTQAMNMLALARAGSSNSPQANMHHQQRMAKLAEALDDYLNGADPEEIRGRFIQTDTPSKAKSRRTKTHA